MAPNITLVRGMRFPCNPEVAVYSLRLEYADLIEVRWPNGETDIMERCKRAPGSYRQEDDPSGRGEFWLRFTYQDWTTALQQMALDQERNGDGSGEPFEIPDLGEMSAADGPGDPEMWGRD